MCYVRSGLRLILVGTALIDLVIISPLLAGATARPAAAEVSRLDRGELMRKVLLSALDDSYRHDGIWPRQLVAPASTDVNVAYICPDRVGSTARELELAGVKVVLHERFAQYPEGVWVGYADGHMEFAPDLATLDACKDQIPILRGGTGHTILSKDTYEKAAFTPRGRLRLKVLDPDGRIVSGAVVGVWGLFGDESPASPHSYFSESGKKVEAAISDAQGELTVEAAAVFASRFRVAGEPIARLYALDETRGLAAVEEVRNSEFGTERIHEIRLLPACKVTAHLTSLGLGETGRSLVRVNAIAFAPGQFRLRALFSEFSGPRFEFLLPPGDYGIEFHGRDTYPATRYLRVEPGRREVKLQLNLEPVASAQLIGHLAPELRAIKEWKNGGPFRLADLRGKVVLLDFWGYWCGPCNGSMPALMKLYDDFKEKGLVVIAVHDDSVSSIAEMDQKLELVRKDLWGGRDLPFPIALAGGGPSRIKYTNLDAQGSTVADYGIVAFPTTLVIDRDGTVLRELDVRAQNAHQDVEQLLKAY
jgi:thiol-disulfide isomerase/thioredoxin